MKISILISHKQHPVYQVVENWQKKNLENHEIQLCVNKLDLCGGDLLFLISCNDLIKKDIRALYKKSLVVHASDLPQGRGWSPMNWDIVNGKKEITVTLLEVEDKVDSGDIWKKQQISFKGHELVDEINEKLFRVELKLMDFAIANFNHITPVAQRDENATYYPKRTPEDSRLDPDKTIREQFNLLRIADTDRYPAFFDLNGYKYKVILEKT